MKIKSSYFTFLDLGINELMITSLSTINTYIEKVGKQLYKQQF